MTSDSDRLAADGAAIILNDGRTVTLRYTMRSLKKIEDHFGSLAEMQAAMNAMLAGAGKVIGPLAEIAAAGLIHEQITADDFLDLAAPDRMNEYEFAMVAAITEAFPASGKASPTTATQSPSHGSISTVPPSAPEYDLASSGS